MSVSGLDVRYGSVTAVRNASLVLGPGEVRALLGANGAGKSSVIRSIAGMVRSRAGRIESPLGRSILGLSPDRIHSLGIAWVPEGREVFATLTVTENLRVGAFNNVDRANVAARVDEMLDVFPQLKQRASSLGGALSGGEQQMLAIARALMSRPIVILMDEPSLGLAPQVIDTVYEMVERIKGEGIAILLVEQNARRALEVASWAYLMENGEITHEGTSEELLESDVVQRTYLGSNAST